MISKQLCTTMVLQTKKKIILDKKPGVFHSLKDNNLSVVYIILLIRIFAYLDPLLFSPDNFCHAGYYRYRACSGWYGRRPCWVLQNLQFHNPYCLKWILFPDLPHSQPHCTLYNRILEKQSEEKT